MTRRRARADLQRGRRARRRRPSTERKAENGGGEPAAAAPAPRRKAERRHGGKHWRRPATTTEGGAGALLAVRRGCPDGFGDCDDDPSNCETPLDTLIQCGACDVSCSDANGSVACEDGKCVMTECTAGFGDCDEDGTNGCELTLAEDDANCGECGRDCAAGGATCNTGGCTAVVIDPSASGFIARFAGGAMYIMGSGAMPVSNYTLVRIPVDGSARSTVWAASANVGNGALYADETDVYWGVSGTPPSVLKKAATDPADTLPTVVFQPDAQAHYLTAQGANFYWANSTTGMIYARPRRRRWRPKARPSSTSIRARTRASSRARHGCTSWRKTEPWSA